MSLSHSQRPLNVARHFPVRTESEAVHSGVLGLADAHAVNALRRPRDVQNPVSIDDVMDALRRLDGSTH